MEKIKLSEYPSYLEFWYTVFKQVIARMLQNFFMLNSAEHEIFSANEYE